jgi:4-amino-4-deoxy-L-arabinose transferase-like glycosyltransferase
MQEARGKSRNTQYALRITVLLVAFVSLGLTYSVITPIFESPDEPWHFNYVRYVAQGHGLPSMRNNDSGAYQEVGQPPLYYLVAGWVTAPFQPDDLRGLALHNPGFGYHAPGMVNDNKNLMAHTEREAFPWSGAALAIHLARLVSLAFGALMVLAAWGLAREVFPDSNLIPLATAALVALTPQFIFVSSVTSNDSSAAALSTATLWAIARMWRLGVTTRRAALTGLLVGLACLTKTSTILLGIFAVAAILIPSQNSNPVILSRAAKNLRSRIRDAGVLAVVALAVGGWWYGRNAILYGDPLGLSVHLNTPWARPAPIPLTEVLSALPLVYRSFWGAFGWGNVEMSPIIYYALAGVLIAALVGWAAGWLKVRRVSCDLRLVTCLLWCGAVFASLLRWNQQVAAPHGRLLFPMLGAFAVLLVVGLARLPRPRIVLGIIVAGFLLLALAVPFVYIRPAYAHPALFPPDQLGSRLPPASAGVGGRDLLYGNEARLIGFSLDRSSVSPDDWLNVTLCWVAVRPMTNNYTLFIHLLGRENLVVGARNTWPGLGRFPTSLWPVGRAFCDVTPVHVEAWTAAPELYDVEVGLYDAKTDDRLEAANESSEPIMPPLVGRVRVAPTQPLRVSPQRASQADFGSAVLIGFDAPESARPGEAVPLRLYWRAASLLDQDYTVFIHLLDSDGKLIAQADSQPRSGDYPTSAWAAGDVIPDDHTLNLPAHLAPGDYVIRIGLYLAPNGPRLPLKPLAGGAFTLGVLQVMR